MSKLRNIQRAFERHPNVIVFGPLEEKSFGEGYSGGIEHDAHTLSYFVSPIKRISSVLQLNNWFQSLIPNYQNMKPVNKEIFRIICNELGLAHLRFDETGIGYAEEIVNRIQRITDEDFLKGLKGFKSGLRVETEHTKVDLGRMIMIYGCPDERIARRRLKEYKTGSIRESIPSEDYTK